MWSAPGIERGGILEKVQLILRRGVGRCELVLFERDLFGELRQRLAVDVDPAAAGLRQPLAIIPTLRAVLCLGFSRHSQSSFVLSFSASSAARRSSSEIRSTVVSSSSVSCA